MNLKLCYNLFFYLLSKTYNHIINTIVDRAATS